MDLSKQTLFSMITTRLSYLGQREKVIAQNIANSDTPHYQARDLKPLNFKDQIQHQMHQVTPVLTQANHLAPITPPEPFKVQQIKTPYETSLDKNGVVLEEQAQKMSATVGDYQAATTIYKKYLSMIKLVLK
jgi:flagellar basal-body rod protein FlgB